MRALCCPLPQLAEALFARSHLYQILFRHLEIRPRRVGLVVIIGWQWSSSKNLLGSFNLWEMLNSLKSIRFVEIIKIQKLLWNYQDCPNSLVAKYCCLRALFFFHAIFVCWCFCFHWNHQLRQPNPLGSNCGNHPEALRFLVFTNIFVSTTKSFRGKRGNHMEAFHTPRGLGSTFSEVRISKSPDYQFQKTWNW